MAKKAYRVRNWAKYNDSLTKRGSITFWLSEEAIANWYEPVKIHKKGRPQNYSDLAIQTALIIKAMFKLPLRAVEGFITSLFKMLNLSLKSPDYSTICKRQKHLTIKIPRLINQPKEKLNLVIDSTGAKIFGEGEWLIRKHGKSKVRSWRKVHLAVNMDNHMIESCYLTDQKTQDCQALSPLLDGVKQPIEQVIGDGAYDRFSCYQDAANRQYRGIFPPQHNASTSDVRRGNKAKACKEAIANRDWAIRMCQEVGRDEWKNQVGYYKRSLAETAVSRLKRMVSTRLNSRLLINQQQELLIWCNILNSMTMLGMPDSVAI